MFRLVSRRLSLPVNHRSYESASPVSVRSASIAAAIADIKVQYYVEYFLFSIDYLKCSYIKKQMIFSIRSFQFGVVEKNFK